MQIGIIGAGPIGSGLARKLSALGHQVAIANSRVPASLQELAAECGATPASVADAIRDKQVVIVAIPQKNIPDLPKAVFSHLPQSTVVIDTCNYYPKLRDGVMPDLEREGIDSLWVATQLGVPVVKVFNSIFATSLSKKGLPAGDPQRISLAISGDSSTAKAVVAQLVNELGFDPFDLGDLAQSWRQQPGSTIYCRDITLVELQKRVKAMEPELSTLKQRFIAKHQEDQDRMVQDFPAWLKTMH